MGETPDNGLEKQILLLCLKLPVHTGTTMKLPITSIVLAISTGLAAAETAASPFTCAGTGVGACCYTGSSSPGGYDCSQQASGVSVNGQTEWSCPGNLMAGCCATEGNFQICLPILSSPIISKQKATGT